MRFKHATSTTPHSSGSILATARKKILRTRFTPNPILMVKIIVTNWNRLNYLLLRAVMFISRLNFLTPLLKINMILLLNTLLLFMAILLVCLGSWRKCLSRTLSEFNVRKEQKSKVLESPIPTKSPLFPLPSPIPTSSPLKKSAPSPSPTTLSKSTSNLTTNEPDSPTSPIACSQSTKNTNPPNSLTAPII